MVFHFCEAKIIFECAGSSLIVIILVLFGFWTIKYNIIDVYFWPVAHC